MRPARATQPDRILIRLWRDVPLVLLDLAEVDLGFSLAVFAGRRA